MAVIFDNDELESAISESLNSEQRYLPIRLDRVPEDLANSETDKAPAEATEIRTLAVNGSVQAQVAYGLILVCGHGIARDEDAALRWFRIAARSGSPDAYNMLGRCYELGWGVGSNFAEAARWYWLAADQGHAWAQFNLGTLFAHGNGVALDHRQALSYLVKSARQRNPKAMNMIGRYREASPDGASKPQSAALWYRLAAQGGCFRGQFHHARQLAAAGEIETACYWFAASLNQAPPDFRREASSVLAEHPHPSIRNIGGAADSIAVESTA